MAGQIIEVPGQGKVEFPEGMSDADIVAAIQKTSTPSKREFGARDLLAGPDVMATLASGAVAAPVSGLAGIAGTVLPGPSGQGADWQKRVQDTLSIRPRTKLGEVVTSAAAAPFELLHKGAVAAGQKAQDAGLEPAGATAVQTAIETLPVLALGAAGRTGKAPAVAAKEMRNEVRDATYNAARQEGYVFPASATNESWLNRRVEGTAGRQMLNQEATIRNQAVTNKIAAREAGLPENTAITTGKLDVRRNQLAAPYREVAAIDASAAADLAELRQVRADAKKWYSYFDRTANPMVEKRAQRLADRAEVLEGYLEDAARQAGKPDLIDRLRQARQEIAKTYDIERALNEGSADVSAATLGAMLDKGKKLSGGLETIAKAHQAFRPYMGDITAIKNPGVERSRGVVGLAANAAGMHGGIGWLSEGIPLASGPMRSLSLSEMYQNGVGRPSYPAPTMTPSLAALLGSLSQRKQEQR